MPDPIQWRDIQRNQEVGGSWTMMGLVNIRCFRESPPEVIDTIAKLNNLKHYVGASMSGAASGTTSEPVSGGYRDTTASSDTIK